MATAQDYMAQIEKMGSMPDYKREITNQYNDPVLKPLLQEGSDLMASYLPAMFQPFTQMGTSASDMSPAQKLALVGESLGRLGGRMGANKGIQDYYGTQIDNLANRAGQDFQFKQQNLWNLHNAANQRDQFDKQMAESRAARASSMPAAFDYDSFLSKFGQTQDFNPSVAARRILTPARNISAGNGLSTDPRRAARMAGSLAFRGLRR